MGVADQGATFFILRGLRNGYIQVQLFMGGLPQARRIGAAAGWGLFLAASLAAGEPVSRQGLFPSHATVVLLAGVPGDVESEGNYRDQMQSWVALATGSGQVAWSLFGRISIPAIIESIASVIPTGLISMWSGTTAPTGWHLCDGTDGTPDLRGRFVVGQNLTDVDFVAMGQTGGAKDVALTVAQLPPHTHSYNDRNMDANPSGTTGYAKPGSALAAATGSAGNGDMHENLPPYYVLAYIIKI